MPELEYLALYSVNCKRCGFLDEQEAQKFEQCHFTKGNTDCPATELRIVITGKATRMANKLVAARKKRDAATEAKILTAVSKENAAFKSRFYDDLSQLESLCNQSNKSGS